MKPCEHNPKQRCQVCKLAAKRARDVEYPRNNLEKERERGRAKYAAKREEILAQQKAAYAADPKKFIERCKKYQRENPERILSCRSGALFPQGVTKAELLTSQEGNCDLCGRPPTPKNPLVVDHDHGRPDQPNVRSLIHNRCNGGLGFFDDDPQLLRKAAEYLERHQAKFE